MARIIATIGGTALAPGVSKNRRLYTAPMIARAVVRAQERLKAGAEPMVMLTHHEAGDDSREIAGSLTDMSLNEHGLIRWNAGLTDTPAGHDMAALANTEDGQPPHLKNVSIRGYWLGTVRKVKGPDGQPVETADDLEIDGLDFTRKPGVTAAAVDTFAWATRSGQTETTVRVPITESVQEALVTAFTEEATPVAEALPQEIRETLDAFLPERPHVLRNGDCLTCAQLGEAAVPLSKRGSGMQGAGKTWADPGYQSDKKQRYDLSTKANAKAAWSYINQKGNAAKYSAAQLKRVKGRIMKALRSFGVSVAAEGWSIEPAFQVSEAVSEYMGDGDCASRAGSWCINASNGPVSLSLNSWAMDPADLGVILPAAASAVTAALAALDPDMDGDVDVPGVGDGSDPDDDAPDESAPDGTVTEAVPDPDPAPAGHQEEEEPAMAEPTTATPAAETAPAALDPASIAEAAIAAYETARQARKAAKRAALAAAPAAPAETAPAAPAGVAETADERVARLVEERAAARIAAEIPAPVAETEEQRIVRLVEAGVTRAKQQLVASGQITPDRKGLAVGEHTAPQVGDDWDANVHGIPGGPDKPIHKYTTEEMDRHAGPVVTRHVLRDRADLIA
jgi:hypothetical protein